MVLMLMDQPGFVHTVRGCAAGDFPAGAELVVGGVRIVQDHQGIVEGDGAGDGRRCAGDAKAVGHKGVADACVQILEVDMDLSPGAADGDKGQAILVAPFRPGGLP